MAQTLLSVPSVPVEETLARLYVDPNFRARFLADPPFDIDREGLELAAESYARKRAR